MHHQAPLGGQRLCAPESHVGGMSPGWRVPLFRKTSLGCFSTQPVEPGLELALVLVRPGSGSTERLRSDSQGHGPFKKGRSPAISGGPAREEAGSACDVSGTGRCSDRKRRWLHRRHSGLGFRAKVGGERLAIGVTAGKLRQRLSQTLKPWPPCCWAEGESGPGASPEGRDRAGFLRSGAATGAYEFARREERPGQRRRGGHPGQRSLPRLQRWAPRPRSACCCPPAQRPPQWSRSWRMCEGRRQRTQCSPPWPRKVGGDLSRGKADLRPRQQGGRARSTSLTPDPTPWESQ